MQNPLPVRLDKLAATLTRISSSARHAPDPADIVALLHEAYDFIEWTLPVADSALAAELTQINRIIAMWKKSWVTACRLPQQRTLLAAQTWNWSNKIARFLRR